MPTPTFVPFHQTKNTNCIIVDAAGNRGLVLSHWKGANIHPEIADDTSAGIVLNALEKRIHGLDADTVTASHFDTDGFIGVWCIMHPDLALKYSSLLRKAARIGDFREWDPYDEECIRALKLVTWIDTMERTHFYIPFNASEDAEIRACKAKFDWFLPRFKDVLLHTDRYQDEWHSDFDRLMQDWEQIKNQGKYFFYPHIGTVVVETPEPVSYYALFAPTQGYETVVSLYERNRYEVEQKYTTWVDTVSKPVYPRIYLEPLAQRLQQKEISGLIWNVEKITDTGPILRLGNSNLTKAERFASPRNRNIQSSSILPQDFKQTVIAFLEAAYKNVKAKPQWTWEEMHEINSKLIHNILTPT